MTPTPTPDPRPTPAGDAPTPDPRATPAEHPPADAAATGDSPAAADSPADAAGDLPGAAPEGGAHQTDSGDAAEDRPTAGDPPGAADDDEAHPPAPDGEGPPADIDAGGRADPRADVPASVGEADPTAPSDAAEDRSAAADPLDRPAAADPRADADAAPASDDAPAADDPDGEAHPTGRGDAVEDRSAAGDPAGAAADGWAHPTVPDGESPASAVDGTDDAERRPDDIDAAGQADSAGRSADGGSAGVEGGDRSADAAARSFDAASADSVGRPDVAGTPGVYAESGDAATDLAEGPEPPIGGSSAHVDHAERMDGTGAVPAEAKHADGMDLAEAADSSSASTGHADLVDQSGRGEGAEDVPGADGDLVPADPVDRSGSVDGVDVVGAGLDGVGSGSESGESAGFVGESETAGHAAEAGAASSRDDVESLDVERLDGGSLDVESLDVEGAGAVGEATGAVGREVLLPPVPPDPRRQRAEQAGEEPAADVPGESVTSPVRAERMLADPVSAVEGGEHRQPEPVPGGSEDLTGPLGEGVPGEGGGAGLRGPMLAEPVPGGSEDPTGPVGEGVPGEGGGAGRGEHGLPEPVPGGSEDPTEPVGEGVSGEGGGARRRGPMLAEPVPGGSEDPTEPVGEGVPGEGRGAGRGGPMLAEAVPGARAAGERVLADRGPGAEPGVEPGTEWAAEATAASVDAGLGASASAAVDAGESESGSGAAASGGRAGRGRGAGARRGVIAVPELSLVVLVGASGAGKSTFAARHFRRTEVLSSDVCRGLVSDDENDQAATRDAFDVLHYIAGKRLAAGKLTVVDATNVQREARRPLIELARAHDVLPVAIVLDVPELVCLERNRLRPDRNFGDHVLRQQRQQLRRSLRGLAREGFRRVTVLSSPEEIEDARVEREPAWTDKRHERGPFDIIGDIHGCNDELTTLLAELGYEVDADGSSARHPAGRRAFFVGDLVDRGPDIPGVLRRVMGMVAEGSALAVPGNHEDKLLRALRGRKVKVSHGLAQSLEQLGAQPEGFRAQVVDFLDGMVSHYVLDDGLLVVAHAGMKEALQGRASGRVRAFALYGETTGEVDELGLPVRYPWAEDYRGRATVVYGHTPVPEPRWVNNTICIDTGCVFGGSLTALRYPEKELVAVPATEVHYAPVRPLAPPEQDGEDGADGEAEEAHEGTPPGKGPFDRPGDLLDVEDVMGKRRVETRLLPSVTVREENAIAALEVMSRFAIDPRWLVYLPPTMAPTATSEQPGLLEHPAEAFAAFRADGVDRVICEEKHMGSRAVVVVCRDAEAAARRFGAPSDGAGVIHTRTGRPFFGADTATEVALLERVRGAAEVTGLWDELATDWLVLDAELMPWSAKALDLLRAQYAPVAAAGRAATGAAVEALAAAVARGVDLGPVHGRLAGRQQMLDDYAEAYGRYCWTVDGIDQLRLAPFAVLAGEGELLAARSHEWHMDVAARLAGADGGNGREAVLMATDYRIVDLTDRLNEAEATQWWDDLTAAGGEGMVVKPVDAIVGGGRHGLVQPGIKCRGREYLRIIYGPGYTEPANLDRLRQRGLGHKRSLAQREFALGIEALERFVAGEPLYRVHECVFGVLALESEPVDPRL